VSGGDSHQQQQQQQLNEDGAVSLLELRTNQLDGSYPVDASVHPEAAKHPHSKVDFSVMPKYKLLKPWEVRVVRIGYYEKEPVCVEEDIFQCPHYVRDPKPPGKKPNPFKPEKRKKKKPSKTKLAAKAVPGQPFKGFPKRKHKKMKRVPPSSSKKAGAEYITQRDLGDPAKDPSRPKGVGKGWYKPDVGPMGEPLSYRRYKLLKAEYLASQDDTIPLDNPRRRALHAFFNNLPGVLTADGAPVKKRAITRNTAHDNLLNEPMITLGEPEGQEGDTKVVVASKADMAKMKKARAARGRARRARRRGLHRSDEDCIESDAVCVVIRPGKRCAVVVAVVRNAIAAESASEAPRRGSVVVAKVASEPLLGKRAVVVGSAARTVAVAERRRDCAAVMAAIAAARVARSPVADVDDDVGDRSLNSEGSAPRTKRA